MSNFENLCSHIDTVIDEREGSTVCVECGLVLENKFFVSNFQESNYEEKDC